MKLLPITETDIPIIEKWLEDATIFYYLHTEPVNKELPLISFGIWVNGSLIGWASLQNIDYENLKAEFGIAIPNQKNQRLGVFATIKVLTYAFQKLGLNRVYIRPLVSNVKPPGEDIRDRAECSFIREGIERQSVKRGDIYEDVIVMSILRDEFERKWL